MMLPLVDPVAGGASREPAEADGLVIGELWVSFVSLLRSHLGALQTTGKLAQANFVPISQSEFEVVDLARTLHITLQVTSGEGEWSLRRMGDMVGAGSWMLYPEATAVIDQGKILDMELAVEAFIEKLWARTPSAILAPTAEEAKL